MRGQLLDVVGWGVITCLFVFSVGYCVSERFGPVDAIASYISACKKSYGLYSLSRRGRCEVQTRALCVVTLHGLPHA